MLEHLHAAPQEERQARKGSRGKRVGSALNQGQAVPLDEIGELAPPAVETLAGSQLAGCR